jgi:hypothetical protein
MARSWIDNNDGKIESNVQTAIIGKSWLWNPGSFAIPGNDEHAQIGQLGYGR